MQLYFLEGIEQFQAVPRLSNRLQAFLLQHEAEHNLLLALLLRWLNCPDRFPEPPRIAIVEENDNILAIAFQEPSQNLVLSRCEQKAALDLIAAAMAQRQIVLPGMGGLVAELQHFRQAWYQLTKQTYVSATQMRIYGLAAVEPIALVAGKLRLATAADRPLLLQWYRDFDLEAMPTSSSMQEIDRTVDRGLQAQSIYLWEDGQPVSLVSGRKALPTAGRIAPVYTPPEYRRRGYATAAVAALSQRLLDQGCERCFLFTDLANPTSNHIYQAIGYQPLCDWQEYELS